MAQVLRGKRIHLPNGRRYHKPGRSIGILRPTHGRSERPWHAQLQGFSDRRLAAAVTSSAQVRLLGFPFLNQCVSFILYECFYQIVYSRPFGISLYFPVSVNFTLNFIFTRTQFHLHRLWKGKSNTFQPCNAVHVHSTPFHTMRHRFLVRRFMEDIELYKKSETYVLLVGPEDRAGDFLSHPVFRNTANMLYFGHPIRPAAKGVPGLTSAQGQFTTSTKRRSISPQFSRSQFVHDNETGKFPSRKIRQKKSREGEKRKRGKREKA